MRKSLLFIAMFAITLTGFSQFVASPKMQKAKKLTMETRGVNAPVATLTYSSDNLATNAGFSQAATIMALVDFPASTMTTYNGDVINKISIGINPSNLTGDIILKIYTDTSNFGATPAATQTVAVSSLTDGWNEITLSTPFSIDGSEIWVGYECNSNDYGMYMDDQASEANGYGDIIYSTLIGGWANVSGLGLDHNWGIKAMVDDGASFIDALVTGVTVPNAMCELTATEEVVATVKNNGTADITTAFNMAYTLNGGTEVVLPVTVPLAVGASTDVTFNIDMSADGLYSINAYTQLTGDMDLNNDTVVNATANTVANTVPMSVIFDGTALDYIGWNNEDVNADGSAWGVYDISGATFGPAHAGTNAALYQYNATNNADDYMYSNCIDLAPGTYTLKFWTVVDASYPEKLSVKIGQGQNAAAMTTTIVDLGTISNGTWTETVANFTIATAGTYNLGFYAYSDADADFIALDDISLEIATSVENTVANAEVNIYPNPTTGLVNVTNVENATINVYNTVGELVKTVSNTNTVDLSDVQNGTYIVKVITNNNIVVKNIVLAK